MAEDHQVADVHSGGQLVNLLGDLGGIAQDDVALFDHRLERQLLRAVGGLRSAGLGSIGCIGFTPGGGLPGGPLDHAFHTGTHGVGRLVAGRVCVAGIHVQAGVEEVLRRLAVQVPGLGLGVGHGNELSEAALERIGLLAQVLDLLPEPLHGAQPGLVAEVAEVAVHEILGGTPVPRVHRAAAGNPDRRVGLLYGPGPHVDVAQLVVVAVEAEHLVRRPCLPDEIDALVVALPQRGGILAVGVDGVHRRADREARDHAPAGDAVEHGDLFGHTQRRVVQRHRVAQHDDVGVGAVS